MTKNISASGSSRRSFINTIVLVTGAIAIAIIPIVFATSFAKAETLNRQLEIGMRGTDVSALQTFLAQDPSIYPQGLVTGYFGYLTKSAVANFQSRNGISTVGRVGPITLVAINQQMANGIGSGVDMSAPTITSVNINTSNTGATASWTTSDSARGKFFYSTSPIRLSNTFEQTGINFVEPNVSGTLASYDAGARTSQSVNISGLSPNTTYYYLVEALDSSNNVSITVPNYFLTK